MKKLFLISTLLLLVSNVFAGSKEVNILTDRAEFHMKPIVDWYKENKPDVKLNITYTKDGLAIKALSDTSYDIILSNEVSNLSVLSEKGYLSSYKPEGNFESSLIKPGYGIVSYRARVFYHKKGTEPKVISYEDILFKNNVKYCIRPIDHNYNVGLATQLLSIYPESKVQLIFNKLASNTSFIGGNDREAVKGLYEGKCDIAIANTYYYAIMLNNPTQKAWAENSQLYFPIDGGQGTPILFGGIGLTKKGESNSYGKEFYNEIYSKEFQKMLTDITYQYPVRNDIELSPIVKSFNPDLKIIKMDLDDVAKYRETAIKIVTEANKLVGKDLK